MDDWVRTYISEIYSETTDSPKNYRVNLKIWKKQNMVQFSLLRGLDRPHNVMRFKSFHKLKNSISF